LYIASSSEKILIRVCRMNCRHSLGWGLIVAGTLLSWFRE
jgi:hypothetical protein